MSDSSRIENAEAAHEAREAVALRPGGSSAASIEAAMRRYLSAEQYHELRGAGRPEGETEPTDEAG
jgi:hypothetical protein